MSKKIPLPVLIIAILLVISFNWAFFQPTFFRMHDFTHVARLVEMDQSLRAGHLPVHWTQNFGYGYGMPLFLFYGPLPSYLGTILHLVGITPVWSVKLIFVLSGVLAFAGMLTLLRRFGYSCALAGATLLLAAPYRAVDVFVRGALNEALAIGILPWILHSILLGQQKPKLGYPLTAFWTALLILSHNLTALISLPFLYLIGLVMIARQAQKKVWHLVYLTIAGSGGIILSLFYALPSFMEKNQTIIGEILTGYFDFRLHFLYIRQLIIPRWGYGGSEFGPNDGISFHLGFPLLAILALTIFLLAKRVLNQYRHNHRLHLNEKDWLILTMLVGSTIALGLSLTHSQPIWENVALLSFIQFPWRFLSIAIVLLSAVAGVGLAQIGSRLGRRLMALLVVLTVLIGQLKFHQPEQYLNSDEEFYYTDPNRIRKQMSDILPDYLPHGFDRKLPPIESTERISVEPSAGLDWQTNQPHRLLATTQAQGGGQIIWNIADFAGWEYYVNEEKISPTKLADGRASFQSNNPITSVGANFYPTPIRSWSLLISLVGWIIWLALLAPNLKRKL